MANALQEFAVNLGINAVPGAGIFIKPGKDTPKANTIDSADPTKRKVVNSKSPWGRTLYVDSGTPDPMDPSQNIWIKNPAKLTGGDKFKDGIGEFFYHEMKGPGEGVFSSVMVWLMLMVFDVMLRGLDPNRK